jgi:hypothetical protein
MFIKGTLWFVIVFGVHFVLRLCRNSPAATPKPKYSRVRCAFCFAALPPDVRRWLCLAENGFIKIIGAAPLAAA